MEKFLGYILFFIGLICILFAFHAMHNVFTNAAQPPEIFQMQNLNLSASSGAGSQPTQIQIALDPELRKIVNVFLYYLFMIFMVIMGSKISSLGIQLTKEIKVKTGGQG